MSELTTAARPYARAAYAVACEQDKQQWTQMLSTLSQAMQTPEVCSLISDLRYPPEKVAEVIKALLEGDALLNDKVWNFIRMLASNRRLVLIPEIAILFDQFATEDNQVVRAEVISAMPLDEQQQATMTQTISQYVGRDAKVSWKVDSALLGGAVVRIGDQTIDGSIRSRLQQFSAAITA